MPLPERLGRYQVLGELATGGMAEILLARIQGPSGFERPVVIKRILPHLARQEAFVTMFLDEARIVAGIRHHNVVNVQELVREEQDLFLVMEYLEGESAAGLGRRLLSRDETLDRALGAHIVAEACAGLHAAHELVDADGHRQELVHRDVSPQNLFVTYDGQVKVLDFGIAKAADRITHTEAGQLKGKLEYMSPEQCRSATLDRRSDIFSLGAVLYELTTGRRLFKRPDRVATIRAICSEGVLAPSRLIADYPPALEQICMRALAIAPAERYPTAVDMRKELLAALDELPRVEGAPGGALAKLMQAIFADRVLEKMEMLRRMRSGSAVTHVPASEIDEDVEVRGVPSPPSASPDAAMPAVAQEPLVRQSGVSTNQTLRGLVAVAGALLAAGISVAWWRHAPPPRETLSVSPAPAPLSAPVPSTSTKPRASEISVHVETRPAGAGVRVDGRERGTTPLDVRVPWSERAIEVELRARGYANLSRSFVPDSDQTLVLDLTPQRSPARPSAGAAANPTATAPNPWTKWN